MPFSCTRAWRLARRALILGVTASSLGACAHSGAPGIENVFSEAPALEVKTNTVDALRSLPPPKEKLYVAVYKFTDQTGQQKPNENFAEYSRAVTQGGAAILINALRNAKPWFTVIERESLPNLLQERQIIRATRNEWMGPDGKPLGPVPAMLNAGLILEGGIVGYDANTLTGGVGARFLGIGGDTQYRRDTVSVYLRAIAVQNGQVVASVNTNKTVYSVGLSGGAFKFVSLKKLLELEGGFTTNEPVHLAVKQAIEKAVHALVVQGVIEGEWQFRDKLEQDRYVAAYQAELAGEASGMLPAQMMAGTPVDEGKRVKAEPRAQKVAMANSGT